MLLDLSKKLSDIDTDFSLVVNSFGNMYMLGVVDANMGMIYSFQSTSIEECYERVNKFIEAVKDDEAFEKFSKEIEELELEVM